MEKLHVKKVFAAGLAGVLALSVPMSTFAADYTASDWWSLYEAFNNTYNNQVGDTTVVITLNGTLTGNADRDSELYALYHNLCYKAGWTYTINGKDYVLSNVKLVAASEESSDEASRAKVTINGDVAYYNGYVGDQAVEEDPDEVRPSYSYALQAVGSVDVTVNGDVTSKYTEEDLAWDSETNKVIPETVEYGSSGVKATEGASVTVTGSVDAMLYGVTAAGEGSSVTVGDGVTSEYCDGIYAADGASVDVTGDVTGGDSVYDEYGSWGEAGHGIFAGGTDTTVTVDGDVYGGTTHFFVDYADGQAAISAQDGASVAVTGDVYGGDGTEDYCYGGVGISTDSTADITVDGNVYGGDGTYGAASAVDIYLTFAPADAEDSGVDANGSITITGEAVAGSGPENDETNAVSLEPDSDVAKLLIGENGAVSGNTSEFISGSDVEDYNFDPTDPTTLTPQNYMNAINGTVAKLSKLLISYGYSYATINAYMQGLIDTAYNAIEAQAPDLKEADPDDLTSDQLLELYQIMRPVYDQYLTDSILPELTIYGMTSDPESVDAIGINSYDLSDTQEGELIDQLLADTNYILHVLDCTNGSVAVDVTTPENNVVSEEAGTFTTAQLGDVITITPAAADGYVVDKVYVKGAEITPVDGQYQYTVADETGYVDIYATFKQEEKVEPEFVPVHYKKNCDKAEPTVTKTSTEQKTASPKTGDNSNIGMFALILVAAGCAIVVLLIVRRKRN